LYQKCNHKSQLLKIELQNNNVGGGGWGTMAILFQAIIVTANVKICF
jgi:hypothetical protein